MILNHPFTTLVIVGCMFVLFFGALAKSPSRVAKRSSAGPISIVYSFFFGLSALFFIAPLLLSVVCFYEDALDCSDAGLFGFVGWPLGGVLFLVGIIVKNLAAIFKK